MAPPPRGPRPAFLARTLPVALLLAVSIGYRLPALVNAGSVNSDVAVVGLQAMHMLHGRWSWFLPGSGYQTSVDSAFAALWFLVTGPGPLPLMLSAFANYLVLTLLAYATLGRHLGRWTALVAVLPLVFTTPSVHTYALHPPRQAALTLVFASIWLVDGASRARRQYLHYGLGTALAFLAYFADPYALVFLPAVMLFAALATRDGKPDTRTANRRVIAGMAGVVLGAVPVTLLRLSAAATPGQTTLRGGLLAHNARLLLGQCLPWALGYRVYFDPDMTHYVIWQPGMAFGAVQKLGAAICIASFVAAFALFFSTRIPWQLRRIGLCGAVVLPLTVAGFLGSVMVMDLFSMRYLAAIPLALPLALAPIAASLERRRLALLLAPYLASAAVCGWLGFAPFVRGPRIVDTGAGDATRRLEVALEARGVHDAFADYWVSYRATFLSRERFVVVPLHADLDRYAPYRRSVEAASRYAYIYDAYRSREDVARTARKMPGRRLGEIRIRQLRAVVFQRSPASRPAARVL